MKGWFEDGNGNKSMARVIVFGAFCLGAGIAAAGLVGWFLKYPDAVSIVGLGSAIVGSGELLKWGQKMQEAGNEK